MTGSPTYMLRITRREHCARRLTEATDQRARDMWQIALDAIDIQLWNEELDGV